jgi:hypothetical protein
MVLLLIFVIVLVLDAVVRTARPRGTASTWAETPGTPLSLL